MSRVIRVGYSLLLIAWLPLKGMALTNNLALTPPMGWNDWNAYGCGISEFIVTNNAGVIAANGMKAAGYQYIDVDDGWASSRDSNGVIQPYSLANKFPDGIPWLANYVHGMGLKLGIYTDHGTNTCSSCITGETPPKDPGSYGYEYVDAMTYGSWHVDYLKEDNCNIPAVANAQVDYGKMSQGLMDSGQPILFCLCGGNGTSGGKAYQSWSPSTGNYWRSTGDIGSTFASMISHVDPNSTTAFAAGPGRWNDPDMLEIGNGEFVTNLVGAQTHFSMWCEMAAPLIAGDNVTTISAQSLAILTNSEAIAVDQDPAGEQGVLVGGIKDSAEVWSRPLGYDFTTRAVALLNRSTTTPAVITCNFTNLAFQAGTTATVRDLWGHTNWGTYTNSFTATVPPYATLLLKMVGTPIVPPPPGTNYLSTTQPIYAYTGGGTIVPNESIGGNTITLGGVQYTNGIGVNSYSGIEYNLGGVCSRFSATIGIDDEVGNNGTVIFQVFADGTKIYDSGVITGSSAPLAINLDVTGVRRLTLGVGTDDDGTGNDHADWANALVIATNAPQVPEMPQGLAASPGNPVRLLWNNTLAALTYNVKRGLQSGGPYTNIANVPVNSFADSNIVSGTTYYYVVSALSSLGEGSNSVEASVTACTLPSPPTGVVTSSSSSQVTVSWNASAGATSYNVYRFTPGTPPALVGSGIMTTSFADTSVAGAGAVTNYYYVTAVNSCNQSGWNGFTAAVTPPFAPTGLNAAGGNDSVDLTWNPVAGAGGYDVFRSTTNGGPYTLIANNVPNAAYLDTMVINGTSYYYVVSAVNNGGQSPVSAQASAVPVAPVTADWTNNIVSSAQNWNVNGNWTNVSNFPNTGGELAVINNGLSGPQTINLNQAVTIGALQIGDANGLSSYTIAADGGSLIFGNTGTLVLTQLPSSHGDILATPVSLLASVVVVNDSVNPLVLAGLLTSQNSATLTIGSGTLQVDNGTGSGSLGAVNVANNGVLLFDCGGNATNSGVISGSGPVTNIGPGTLQLNAVETYTGPTVVNAGFLELNGPNSVPSVLNSSSSLTINNGGTVEILGNNSLTGAGATLGTLPITVNAGGTLTGAASANGGAGTTTHIRCMIDLNGGTLANGGTGTGSSAFGSWALDDGLATSGGTNTSSITALCVVPSESGGTAFNIAKGATASGVDLLVSGTFTNAPSENDTGIIKTGSGTMEFTGINSYLGNTFVNGGTLALAGSGTINSSVRVAMNNATFSMSSSAACTNGQFALTNATLQLAVSGGMTNEMAGTLSLGGTTNIVNISSLPSANNFPQTYHLISYATLNGTFNMGLGSLPIGYRGFVTNENNFVDLIVTTNSTGAQLVWTGIDPSNPGSWNIGVSANWLSNGLSSTYAQGDVVRLDDTAPGQTNILLTGVLTPAALTVSNNALVYNLGDGGQGGGRINGATGLTKQGTNLLVLDESNTSGSYNDFSGGLTISAGSVQVGNGDHNGAVGSSSVTDNGALVFDRSDNITNANVISGNGSLAQNGVGVLTLSGANGYLGATLIQNGTLQINNNSAFGPTNAGVVTITNGGTMDIGGPAFGSQGFLLGLKQIYVSGWGVSSNGAIVNNSGTYQYANNNLMLVTLQGDTAIGGSGQGTPGNGNTPGRWDLRGTAGEPAVLSTGGHPYNLFKVGGNQIVIVNTLVDTNLANIDVRQGFLEVQGITTLGNPTNNLTVETGATFGMFQGSTNLNKNMVLNGDGVNYSLFSEGSTNALLGPVTLNSGPCVLGGATGKSLTLFNSIGGTGALVVSNAMINLLGTNSYTGNTIVLAGTLALMGNGTISNSPQIAVNGIATLDASQRNDTTLTLAPGQTLTGSGTVKGNVVVGNGATLLPGGGVGTIVLNNNLVFSAGSTALMQVNKSLSPSNDTAQVTGSVTYSGTLIVTNIGNIAFSAGDSFRLFKGASFSGTFANIVPAIPGINLAWNTNNLYSGFLGVVTSPTPSPRIAAATMNGSAFIFSGSNGVPGWPYWVLASTNLSLPMTNWTLISTGAFDSSGNFIFTNPMNPAGPQNYYLLQLH